ncbi:MAG: hypothetical protein LBL58_04970 [Tannerellaceae bacterium]|jgi:hypothetical protein|nr:hypothetical protein [Tannerellaceae bacterium]
MKKLWLLIFAVIPFCVIAQQQTEYNRKGDEAMKRLDYSDARLFYGEGVPYCDMYSINQLTTIWIANEQMRTSMHNQMSRCLSCLSVKATENDTTAVSKLILYYTEGIGTPKSEELAFYWTDRLEELQNPVPENNGYSGYEKPVRTPMQFFGGYTYSQQAPFGITIGGVGERFGWYVRFKTNMSFQSSDYEFSGKRFNREGEFKNNHKKKTNSYAATAGLLIKCTPWLYTSVGAGYGKRDLLYQYTRLNNDLEELETEWYKKMDSSYNGASIDLDFMLHFGFLYVNVGCNTLNFEYVDLNAGIGVFF